MPDSFFTSSKPRKRKRTNDAGPSSSKKVPRKGAQQNGVRFQGPKSNGVQKKKRKTADEELDSDHTDDDAGNIDDIDLRAPSDDDEVSGEEDPDETPAEKRLRLAQLYIDGVKEGLKLADGEFDAAEIDRELITARLKQDVLEHSGKIHLFIADSFDFSEPPKTIFRTKTSKSSVTCAVAAESGQYLFTSEKDGTITKWDLTSRKKTVIFHSIRTQAKGKGKAQASSEEVKGHTDEVLALALSDDGKYLASGGKDRRLGVWDAENAQWIRGFIGPMCHKDTISALSFRKGTHQLYTGSLDRSLKVFDLSPGVMGYVETLFGHQDHVVALDSLRGETCVSVGARDKTARYWKIVEETQLVFRGGGRSRVRDVLEGGLADQEDGEPEPKRDVTMKFVEGRLECVAMIDESMFVSGGDSGSICLWMTQKKKPVFTQPLSHGFNEVSSETEGVIKTPRWVTALASLRYSDLFASGSWEGDIRLWKLDSKLKSFSLVGAIPALGVVNSLQFVSPPKSFFDGAEWTKEGQPSTDDASKRRGAGRYLLIAGMGREHKFGRWQNVKEGWNRALVVALSPRTSS